MSSSAAQNLESVTAALWEPAGIDQPDAERLLGRLMGQSIDYGELYFQHKRSESWAL